MKLSQGHFAVSLFVQFEPILLPSCTKFRPELKLPIILAFSCFGFTVLGDLLYPRYIKVKVENYLLFMFSPPKTS
jgi:hypothetical protein